MTFGEAIDQMRKGRVVARRAWPGHARNEGIAIKKVDGNPTAHYVCQGLFTGGGFWRPRSEDMFAQDWEVVEQRSPK